MLKSDSLITSLNYLTQETISGGNNLGNFSTMILFIIIWWHGPGPWTRAEYFRVLEARERGFRGWSPRARAFQTWKEAPPPNLQKGNFAEVIADVEGLMKTPLQQAGFRLETENALTEPFLYDREIMVQVLINLIENSVKFGQSSPAKRITLRLRPAGDHVRIEVADTGPASPMGMLKDLQRLLPRRQRRDAAAGEPV